jgi:hypothetical protein
MWVRLRSCDRIDSKVLLVGDFKNPVLWKKGRESKESRVRLVRG